MSSCKHFAYVLVRLLLRLVREHKIHTQTEQLTYQCDWLSGYAI